MEPSSKKFSFLPAVGTEVVIVAVLVILIIVTFNYFNIIPFSIPFLPHQVNNSKTTSQKNTQVNVYKFARNPKCENLPAGIVIPTIKQNPPAAVNLPTGVAKSKISINPTISPLLKSYLGVWSGKWDGKTPTAIIFTNFSNAGANARYFFNGQAQKIGSVYNVSNNSLVSTDKFLSWKIAGDTLMGTFYKNGKPTSTVVMTKCNL